MRTVPLPRFGALALSVALVLCAEEAAGQHRVGPQDFPTITQAVAAAAPHDTVIVSPGVYREETRVLTRPITLMGEPGAVLDGEGERELVVVEADSVTVQGFTLRDTGIAFTEDRYVPVEEATISMLDWGFLRSDANQDTISARRPTSSVPSRRSGPRRRDRRTRSSSRAPRAG